MPAWHVLVSQTKKERERKKLRKSAVQRKTFISENI
jgi:hypothetical protein